MDRSRSSSRRLERERKTVQIMIQIYCQFHHHTAKGLCEECRQLAEYAEKRLVKCPYGHDKPTCARCPTHCYKPARREEIRRVMRFAGPRMILRHPCLALGHILDDRAKHSLRRLK
ncbi:nitrous oxide-stimulated promoter family protein [candidate division KSB1 bacterium]|nr:nitrous oxide-stimulated promoter family protein [candidate division KSB1 bacterium]